MGYLDESEARVIHFVAGFSVGLLGIWIGCTRASKFPETLNKRHPTGGFYQWDV